MPSQHSRDDEIMNLWLTGAAESKRTTASREKNLFYDIHKFFVLSEVNGPQAGSLHLELYLPRIERHWSFWDRPHKRRNSRGHRESAPDLMKQELENMPIT